MSAQLPPEVDAIVTTAVGAAVDLVLGVVPAQARDLLDPDAVRGQLERWARALVADIIAPPVRVTVADGGEVEVTIR